MLFGYLYRKSIAIDHEKIDEDLTDFPVLVYLSASNFAFPLARADGFDIRFTLDDETTLLDYERVSHDAVGQTAEYWVKVPTVEAANDTVIYMWYGNVAAADGQNAADVWSNGYAAVYHMGDATPTTIADATGNGNTGTKKASGEPVAAAGKIGSAQSFDGTNDYINHGNVLNQPTNDFTVQAYAKSTSTATSVDNGIIYKKGTGYIYASGYGLNMPNGAFQLIIGDGANYTQKITTSGIYNDGNWHHVVGVVRRGTEIRIYADGASIGSTSSSMTGDISSTTNFAIGALRTAYTYHTFLGEIDEVRISTVARSSAWVKADYNSGNNTLISVSDDWTIDTESRRRAVAGLGPIPDGDIGSYWDRRQIAGNYINFPLPVLVGGNLLFNGGLDRGVFRAVGGNLPLNGILGRLITPSIMGGQLTFNGTLTTTTIFLASVGGNLTFNGLLTGGNPDWLLIPDYLNWMGVWDAGTTYAIGDAVLITEGDRPFAYASRIGSNLAHTPGTDTSWYRIQQEPWRKA